MTDKKRITISVSQEIYDWLAMLRIENAINISKFINYNLEKIKGGDEVDKQ